MLLKRLELHRIKIFWWCGTNFSYTQARKITPTGNTLRLHQYGKQSREGWPDCARRVL